MEHDQFDRAAAETASGISRRRALRLLGGGVAGGFLALRAVPAFASPRCRRPGEECDREKACCNGVCCAGVCCRPGQVCQDGRCVAPPAKTSFQTCICGDGTIFNVCAAVNCDSGPAQDVICGPLCAPLGGEVATGCFSNDPRCPA
jgi:hypothetical protein